MVTIYDKYFTGVCIRQHCNETWKSTYCVTACYHSTSTGLILCIIMLLCVLPYKGFFYSSLKQTLWEGLGDGAYIRNGLTFQNVCLWNSVTSILMSEILGVLSPHPFTPHHQSHRAAWLQISQHLWLTVDLNQSQESCASYYTFVRVLSANSPVSTPRESIDSHAVLSVFTVTAA